jgi:hypothetical protein
LKLFFSFLKKYTNIEKYIFIIEYCHTKIEKIFFMQYNETLVSTYEQIGTIRNQLKEKVKAIMGWRADAAFYDRVNGRVKCTPAEQEAFTKAVKELSLSIPSDLFPEGEAVKIVTAE